MTPIRMPSRRGRVVHAPFSEAKFVSGHPHVRLSGPIYRERFVTFTLVGFLAVVSLGESARALERKRRDRDRGCCEKARLLLCMAGSFVRSLASAQLKPASRTWSPFKAIGPRFVKTRTRIQRGGRSRALLTNLEESTRRRPYALRCVPRTAHRGARSACVLASREQQASGAPCSDDDHDDDGSKPCMMSGMQANCACAF